MPNFNYSIYSDCENYVSFFLGVVFLHVNYLSYIFFCHVCGLPTPTSHPSNSVLLAKYCMGYNDALKNSWFIRNPNLTGHIWDILLLKMFIWSSNLTRILYFIWQFTLYPLLLTCRCLISLWNVLAGLLFHKTAMIQCHLNDNRLGVWDKLNYCALAFE